MRVACENLRFSYPNAGQLLADVSFAFEGPGFHGLVGDSGVGKSTLAKILSGLLQGWEAEELQQPQRVLYCFGEERLPCWLPVGEHLARVAPASPESLLNELIECFSLSQATCDARPRQTSTGEHNRLNLIRYLLQDFDLLILDEALGNVDEPTRRRILEDIRARFADRIILYISHHLRDVALFSQQVLVLRPGPGGSTVHRLPGCNCTHPVDVDNAALSESVRRIVEYV